MSLDDLCVTSRSGAPGERGGAAGRPGPAHGLRGLDRCLPGGGWPARGSIEILADRTGIGELSLLMPALARLVRRGARGGWLAWIAPPHQPYAPALAPAASTSNACSSCARRRRSGRWSRRCAPGPAARCSAGPPAATGRACAGCNSRRSRRAAWPCCSAGWRMAASFARGAAHRARRRPRRPRGRDPEEPWRTCALRAARLDSAAAPRARALTMALPASTGSRPKSRRRRSPAIPRSRSRPALGGGRRAARASRARRRDGRRTLARGAPAATTCSSRCAGLPRT